MADSLASFTGSIFLVVALVLFITYLRRKNSGTGVAVTRSVYQPPVAYMPQPTIVTPQPAVVIAHPVVMAQQPYMMVHQQPTYAQAAPAMPKTGNYPGAPPAYTPVSLS